MELFNLIIFAMVFSVSLMAFMVVGLLAVSNIMTSQRFMKKYTENICSLSETKDRNQIEKD